MVTTIQNISIQGYLGEIPPFYFFYYFCEVVIDYICMVCKEKKSSPFLTDNSGFLISVSVAQRDRISLLVQTDERAIAFSISFTS